MAWERVLSILPIGLGFAPLCLEGSSALGRRPWAAQTFDCPSSGRGRGGCLGRSDLAIGFGVHHGRLVDHPVDCTFGYHANHSDLREGSPLGFHEGFRSASRAEGSYAPEHLSVRKTSFYYTSGLGVCQ